MKNKYGFKWVLVYVNISVYDDAGDQKSETRTIGIHSEQ